jgi:hypothetical protein
MVNQSGRFLRAGKSLLSPKASVLAVITIFGVLAAGGAKWSQLRGDQNDNGLQGSWEIQISGTPFRILRTIGPEGVVDSYDFPPITPTQGALVNSGGHGNWSKIGPNEYSVTVEYFQLNPTAAFDKQLDSVGKVRENIRVSKDGKSYVSIFETTISLPDGTPIIPNSGRTTATKIAVEPIAGHP